MANDLNRKAVVFIADAHKIALTDADNGYHESYSASRLNQPQLFL
jgi:hypothetical protein